ncbi:hypothetical protein Pyn_26734 [Prunus yedoensis var. nudiflora]|uniref:Disease resistance protein n=1 Tax=Prunus yedoensis var. nudiflora TaxID=2094558 RepID=A0A314UWZ7_PRUYE|nr:hypothetical protein Pyn_26734 [Prunus yedoensis var. nudiflora]
MHDLLREIALSIAKEEKFCAVHDGSETVEETGALRSSIQTTNGEIGTCTGASRIHWTAPQLADLEHHGDKNREALPRGISMLLNLRMLLVSRLISGKLKNLGISNVKERDEEDLCASIQEMKVLSKLGLWVANGEDFLRVNGLSSPPPYLDSLKLVGKLEKFRNLALLNKITIEKGAMPNLELLDIRCCMTLETLSQGIEHLTKLQGYIFDNISEKFRESIKGGVDHPRMLLVDERCKKYT